jgi:hypothetical protein
VQHGKAAPRWPWEDGFLSIIDHLPRMVDKGDMVEFPPGFPFVRGASSPQPSEQVAPQSNNLPPSDEPVQAVSPLASSSIDPAVAAPAKPFVERRKYQRDRMAAQALIHLDGRRLPPAKVTLVDVSIAGARFQASRPLDVGDKLQIRLEVGPFRWTTRMRVIHCTSSDSQNCLIGCAFLRTEILRPWPAAA